MTAQRDSGDVIEMPSKEVRDNWGDVVKRVLRGTTIIVTHYGKPIARIVPESETRDKGGSA